MSFETFGQRRSARARIARLACGATITFAGVLATRVANAAPQWNLGVNTAVCGLGEDDQFWSETGWCNGIRADVLLFRNRNADFGIGPYLQLSTADFADLRAAGGASLLVPVFSGDFPIVLSAGPYTRNFDGIGLDASLFWGLRSHNFHGSYGMAGGIVLGVQRGFGDIAETVTHVGVQIDALWLALPFILGYQALRGPD